MAELVRRLAKASGMIGAIPKDRKNEFHGYDYASADTLLAAVAAALGKCGIAVGTRAELVSYEDREDVKGRGRKKHAVVRLTVRYLYGTAHVSAEGLGSGEDSGDKAVMKAMTAAQKYAHRTGLSIPFGGADPEADASTDRGHAEERASSKGAPSPELSAVLRSIAAATTQAGLDAMRPAIRTWSGRPEYKVLREAYGLRKKVIEQEAAAAAQGG